MLKAWRTRSINQKEDGVYSINQKEEWQKKLRRALKEEGDMPPEQGHVNDGESNAHL
jgi:hypothetical protein